MSSAQLKFKMGNYHPYDGLHHRESVVLADNSAEGAVRGAFADLTTRRGIKKPLFKLDLAERQELFAALVKIVNRESHTEAAKSILEHLEINVPGFSHEMGNLDHAVREKIIEKLVEVIRYAASQAYPLIAPDENRK